LATTPSAVKRNVTTDAALESEPKIREPEEAGKTWAEDSLDRIERHTKPVRKVIVSSGITFPYSLVPFCCSFTIVSVSFRRKNTH
jgi:hypothetical protein